MKPKLMLRDLFWLMLVFQVVAVSADEPPKTGPRKPPKFASTDQIRGSEETRAFLEWSKSRHPMFATAELDEAGNATAVSFHICVSITDEDIKHLRKLTALKSIGGYGACLTDQGLLLLSEMKSLENVSIFGAKRVTHRAIVRLQKARPSLKVEMTHRD